MLSVENILNTLKIKQYNLPKSILLDYDKYEIENESSYLAHIESIDYNTVEIVDKDEDKIRPKKSFSEMKLIKTYQCIQDILGPCLTTYVHSKSNQSLNYRFLESIFTIIDHSFMMNSYHDKQFIMSQWIKKLDDELISKEKYYEFNYIKNRKVKRENLLLSINQAYMNKCDYEIFDNFIQYNADMLNITLIVLNMKHGNIDFEESKVFHYKNIFNPLNPVGIIIYDNGIYFPIIRSKEFDNSLFNYTNQEDKAYVTKIYKYMKYNDFDIEKLVKISKSTMIVEEKVEKIEEKMEEKVQKIEEKVEEKVEEKIEEKVEEKVVKIEEKVKNKYEKSKLEKLKIDELRNIASIENIPIQKLSEKSGKYINKIKGELIEDILNNKNMFSVFENKEDDVKKDDIKEEDVNEEDNESIEEVEYKFSEKSLEKMKISMLQILCVNKNISVTKKSDKTNKDINKVKAELISDLLKSYVL